MRDEHYTLKAAFRRLVKAAGGLEAAEAVAGVSKASLSKWQSIDHDCFAPINVVLHLETEIGTPVVTREILRAQDYAAVPSEGQHSDNRTLQSHILEVVKEVGEAVGAIGERDHFDSLAEYHVVEKEAVNAHTATTDMLDGVRRRRPGRSRKHRKVS